MFDVAFEVIRVAGGAGTLGVGEPEGLRKPAPAGESIKEAERSRGVLLRSGQGCNSAVRGAGFPPGPRTAGTGPS